MQIRVDYLNTSNVTVNREQCAKELAARLNLNTSNVTVNHDEKDREILKH